MTSPDTQGKKMVLNLHRLRPQAVKLMRLLAFCTLSDCYDPLDPNGNITVTIDIYGRTDDGYLCTGKGDSAKLLSISSCDQTLQSTCCPLLDTDPTTVPDFGGQRQIPAYRTWNSKCTYSSFLAYKSPVCCASLSTFYNPTITSCPSCSCGKRPVGFSSRSNDDDDHDIIQCTDHMCPIRVHWHIRNNCRDHWRVKLTISNYLRNRNYSKWNLLVQHPGFSQSATTYSFNSTALPTVAFQEYYNDELVHTEEDGLGGYVSTEILLKKDLHGFTLSNGWAFPTRVYFNGEDCQMPLSDTFPALPNASPLPPPSLLFIFISLLLTAPES